MGALTRAALSVLTDAGLTVAPSKGDTEPYTVDGRFYFWPSSGMWRSIDGRVKGYTARKLAIAAKAEPAP